MKYGHILLLTVSVMLAACTKTSDGEAELRHLLTPWFDALNLAKSSPRHSLAPQIAQMQSLRRQAEAIPVSACMEKPKELYVAYMQSKIDILTEFLSGKDPAVYRINDPNKDFEEFNDAVAKCHTDRH
jgi:hypothetical protein